MNIIISIFSGLVIGFSFKNLKKLSEQFEDVLMVDIKMIVAHAFAYSLNIVSLVLLEIAFLNKETKKSIDTIQVIFLFTSTAT